MFNLREYRPRPTRLADHLPWALLVRPGVILNKDGSLQKSYRFRGPDLASSTDAQILCAAWDPAGVCTLRLIDDPRTIIRYRLFPILSAKGSTMRGDNEPTPAVDSLRPTITLR
jgi:hypothetical protein